MNIPPGIGGICLGPQGPIPIPPHGPERNLLLTTAIVELAGQLDDHTPQTILRQAALEQLVRDVNHLPEMIK